MKDKIFFPNLDNMKKKNRVWETFFLIHLTHTMGYNIKKKDSTFLRSYGTNPTKRFRMIFILNFN